jgi:hypothetical protein
MSQTSYSTYHAKGYEGQRADSRIYTAYPARNNSSAVLPFGRFVVFDAGAGTSELAAKVISASGDKILGVSMRDMAHNPNGLTPGTEGVLDDDMFSVMSKGAIYVKVEQNVTPADPVFARHTAGAGGATVGVARKDADSNTAVAVSGARFVESASAGDIVAIELNLP